MDERNEIMKLNTTQDDTVLVKNMPPSPTSVIDDEPVEVINHFSDEHVSFDRLPYPSDYGRRNRISFTAIIALKENHWANFIGGLFSTLLPVFILPSLGRRYPGMKEGTPTLPAPEVRRPVLIMACRLQEDTWGRACSYWEQSGSPSRFWTSGRATCRWTSRLTLTTTSRDLSLSRPSKVGLPRPPSWELK